MNHQMMNLNVVVKAVVKVVVKAVLMIIRMFHLKVAQVVNLKLKILNKRNKKFYYNLLHLRREV
ncbi:MAG: hypothetical protein CMJ52_09665 [Planctomycetaceae bacterium]|nr:hypothetical protein [Planctomycetaceae bacterium]